VLPGGTAFISDVGMTGSRNGVLGARRDQVLESFLTQMPIRFDSAEGDVWIDAVVVELGGDGLAQSIEQVLMAAPDSP
jgi:calcineurin-like phosphoesterase